MTRSGRVEGARAVGSIAEAIAAARATGKTIFCGGGASIYAQVLPRATDMYLSLIHGEHEGDARFPEWSESEWEETERVEHDAFTFLKLRRRDVASPA